MKKRKPPVGVVFEWPGLGRITMTPEELRRVERGEAVLVRTPNQRRKK